MRVKKQTTETQSRRKTEMGQFGKMECGKTSRKMRPGRGEGEEIKLCTTVSRCDHQGKLFLNRIQRNRCIQRAVALTQLSVTPTSTGSKTNKKQSRLGTFS